MLGLIKACVTLPVKPNKKHLFAQQNDFQRTTPIHTSNVQHESIPHTFQFRRRNTTDTDTRYPCMHLTNRSVLKLHDDVEFTERELLAPKLNVANTTRTHTMRIARNRVLRRVITEVQCSESVDCVYDPMWCSSKCILFV